MIARRLSAKTLRGESARYERPSTEREAAILQAAHTCYRQIDFGRLPGCRVVLDGRNALDRRAIEAAGVVYLGIGRGV